MIREAKSGNAISTLRISDKVDLKTFALSEDGRRIVTSHMGNQIRVWRTSPRSNGRRELEIQSPDPVSAVVFSADGRHIVSGGAGSVRVWNAARGNTIFQTSVFQQAAHQASALFPDGRRALTGGSGTSDSLRVLDLYTGAALNALEGLETQITEVAISPDSERVVFTGRFSHKAFIWTMDPMHQVVTIKGG